MVLQFAFYMIVLITSASAQVIIPYTVNPNCDWICGDVIIIYPFGMGDPTCYIDKWFEVECRNTSQGSKPYIKSINLEVTSTYLDMSIVNIMNPVFRWNCNNSKDAKPVVNLTGSPFVYSKHSNKFTAIGCNTVAFLQSNGSQVSGCVSLCDEYDDNREWSNNIAYGRDGCLGRLCCQTSLPSYLSEFNVTHEDLGLKNGGGGGGGCSRAFIGSDSWNLVYNPASGNFEYRSIFDLDLDFVPAELSWVVLNSSSSMKALPTANNCTMAANSSYGPPGWVCKCYTGYAGNPYIGGGCIDFRAKLHTTFIPILRAVQTPVSVDNLHATSISILMSPERW